MSRLLIATRNVSKLSEIQAILVDPPIAFLTLDIFPNLPEPEETGATFAENARLKAVYYSHATELPSVAEDSGLEIDALDGAPGVRSARYDGRTYPEKFEKIYRALTARGTSESPARFVCAVAFARAGQLVFETRGTIEGYIAPFPRGGGGFGYDPIFYYPPYGRTLAEVSAEEKRAVSHRGAAFRAFREFLMRARLEPGAITPHD